MSEQVESERREEEEKYLKIIDREQSGCKNKKRKK